MLTPDHQPQLSVPQDPASPPHATNPKLDELAAALREAISALSDPDDAKWFVASLLGSPNAASLDLAGAQQLAAMASSDAFEADLVAAVRAGCADTSPDILRRLVADVRAELQGFVVRRDIEIACSAIRQSIESKDLAALSLAVAYADERLERLVTEQVFVAYDYDTGRGDEVRITLKDVQEASPKAREAWLVVDVGERVQPVAVARLEELVTATTAGRWWCSVLRDLPTVDDAQLRRDTAEFGAKAAGLKALERALPSLQALEKEARLHVGLQTAETEYLPVSVFRAYRAGAPLEELLRESHAWVSQQPSDVMVRSSAVYSEDGAHMGAGVYESVRLSQGASLDLFAAAVKHVYDSVDSELAVRYREQIGVTVPEEMGVVLQRFVEPTDRRDAAGHINTVRPQMPEVLEVVSVSRYIPMFSVGRHEGFSVDQSTCVPLHRDILGSTVGSFHSGAEPAAVLPEDYTRGFHSVSAGDLGRAALLLERLFGTPLQVEFAQSGRRTYMLQARPLPPEWTTRSSVTFPDRNDSCFSGESFGVIDEELEVLGDSEENYQRKGVVFLSSSSYGSSHLGRIERLIPRQGAVVLLSRSDFMRGHVESRCAERGVVVIMPKPCEDSWDTLSEAYGSDITGRFRDQIFQGPQALEPHDGFARVRVVSTGLAARVYPA